MAKKDFLAGFIFAIGSYQKNLRNLFLQLVPMRKPLPDSIFRLFLNIKKFAVFNRGILVQSRENIFRKSFFPYGITV